MPSRLSEFKDKNFDNLLKAKENALVLFSAPWCAACKVITPKLEKIAAAYQKIKFIKIDVSKSPGLASRLGVMSLPNILIIQKGKISGQIIGTASEKEIEGKLKKIS